MARQVTIGFKSIQLFKDQTLGIGSYGKVCRAKCDHVPCAAKIIHETLFDPVAEQQMPRGREHRLPIRRFEQECEFLSTIRHPNVIQYLGMYQDPDTGLPVLLMELMDDSLTHFLESSIQPIPYHIRVNFCHDIILALTFLHANGIVHRDLSSNNVLLVGNIRAKVTDFGMAKLGDLSPQASHLTFTMCPGADVYMPPEAVKDQPIYTDKIDCFSFGVIVVQILTLQFPKPGDRQKSVAVDYPGLPSNVYVPVPETERRQNHIRQVDSNDPLLPIALDCLKDRDIERPSALQLCERLLAVKEASEFTDSIRTAQNLERHMQEQLLSLRDQIQGLRSEVAHLNEVVSANQQEIQSRNEVIAARENEIQQLREELEKAMDQATHQMMEKDQMIEQLEGQIGRLNLQAEGGEVSANPMHKLETSAGQGAHPTSIRLSWRVGGEAPVEMNRLCDAVVSGEVVYFNVGDSSTVYCYNTISETWTQMPDYPNKKYSSLVVIGDMLTAIGGIDKYHRDSNKLYLLKREGKTQQWIEEFQPMPTEQSSLVLTR